MLNCKPELTPLDVWFCKDGETSNSKWTIDHKNNVHNDHHPDNLRWITRINHSKLKARVYKNVKQQQHCSGSLMRGEREIFTTSDIFKRLSFKFGTPALQNVRVTNKGRCKLSSGNYNRGYLKYYRKVNATGVVTRVLMSPYRRVKIGKKEFPVHILIMYAKKNCEIPPGSVVMHDDSIPLNIRLDEEGGERNWATDLSIGTYSQNTKSYHHRKMMVNNRRASLRLRNIERVNYYSN
jgi:hypothetical protein